CTALQMWGKRIKKRASQRPARYLSEMEKSVQQTGADSPRNNFHRLQCFLGDVLISFNINNYVAHLSRSLQILRSDVNTLLGKYFVQRSQHARTVFMDVHQSATAM